MTAPPPKPVSVRGGSDGIDARLEDVGQLSALFARAAADTGAAAANLQRHLVNLGAVGGAALDPVGAVRYEEELGLALDGPHGLVVLAASCAVLAAALRAAAAAYRAADELTGEVTTLAHGAFELGRAQWAADKAAWTTRSLTGALDAFAAADPDLVQLTGGGVLALATPLTPVIDKALPDGRAAVRDLDVVDAPTGAAPRSLTDLVAGLEARNAGPGGEVDVRFVYRGDGTRSVIVDIPGTKSWSVGHTSDVTSLATNVRALSGTDTTYGRGVLEAMRRAGVRPAEPVMLVGHSEGGMVAARVAIVASKGTEFRITHVLTAGAPISRVVGQVPSAVQVLAIENKHDVVPELDGSANPPLPNVTTVTVDHDARRAGTNHSIEKSYLPAARDVDACTDESVRSYLAGARDFLDGSGVRTHRFQITRAY